MKGFKGEILPELIMEFNLSKTQTKKLICVISLCDGFGAIYPNNRSEWAIRTRPNIELHSLVYDLFLYAYNVKLPTFFNSCKEGRQRSTEISGKFCEAILKDLFTFTPTLKTCPAKTLKETPYTFFKQPQPNIEFLFNEPVWFQRLALRVIFDLEGAIIPKFEIKKKTYKSKQYFQFQFEAALQISLTHPTLLHQLHQLSSRLGFKFNIKKDLRRWSNLDGIITSKKSGIFHFLKLGGPLTHIRIYKSHKDRICNNNLYFKQVLLKTCCKVLKNKTSRHFKTRREAEKYRNKFIKTIFVPLRNRLQKKEEMGEAGFEPATSRYLPGLSAD